MPPLPPPPPPPPTTMTNDIDEKKQNDELNERYENSYFIKKKNFGIDRCNVSFSVINV
jgi:hypothetical protein